MDNPAVKLWRDKFNLNLSASWKRDVEITIKDLALWSKILEGWWYLDAKGKRRNKAPGVKPLLDEYERILQQRADDAIQQNGRRVYSAESLPPRIEGVLPKQEMPTLLARERGWK